MRNDTYGTTMCRERSYTLSPTKTCWWYWRENWPIWWCGSRCKYTGHMWLLTRNGPLSFTSIYGRPCTACWGQASYFTETEKGARELRVWDKPVWPLHSKQDSIVRIGGGNRQMWREDTKRERQNSKDPEDHRKKTKFSCYLAKIYGPKLAMHTGTKHDYIGMDLEFMVNGTLEVSMHKYLDGIIDDFPELVKGKCATPAAEHLFKVQEASEARHLPKEQVIAFHHSVAQLLSLSTRGRRDIQVAVLFLTTWVKRPYEDDWGKLKRVMKYLNGTRKLKLTLSVESMGIIKWYIDGSHNAH